MGANLQVSSRDSRTTQTVQEPILQLPTTITAPIKSGTSQGPTTECHPVSKAMRPQTLLFLGQLH
jgi:hypothetical protein